MKFRFRDVNEYCEHFLELVELERKAEMRFHMDEIKKLSPEERERKGRAITDLRMRYEGTFLLKFAYSFRKVGSGRLPENEIKVGDVVLASNINPLKDGREGVVIEKTPYSMVVLFQERLPAAWKRARLRLDLYCNDTTFQRMKDALNLIKDGRSEFSMSLLLGVKKRKRSPGGKLEGKADITFFNRRLNPSQKDAVLRALAEEQLFLIHGPPGTGKTTTCVEIIKQLVARGKKVLVCADSNTAVDNVVEKLAGKVYVVRLGHPARISKKLYETTLDFMIASGEEGELIERLTERMESLKKKRSALTRPSRAMRRGLTDEQIMKLARKSRGARGVSGKKIKEMALWLTYTSSLREMAKRRQSLMERAAKRILSSAQVVCTTNAGAFSEFLREERFDVVVVDEATQATEPSCLMPVIKAPKVIMAGDHKQLPPTILSEEAKKNGLELTMFERFMKLYGRTNSVMLEYQYRMNPMLVEFPNRKFYSGRLRSDGSVNNITVLDLIKKENIKPVDKLDRACHSSTPLVWIDTSKLLKRSERRRAESTSLENVVEAGVVRELVNRLVSAGVARSAIGIITPYRDQKELLIKMLADGVEVNTVDGFQGREKEIIILSLVRSNEEKKIGFLRDERRLNVAITRAKRKLMVVADASTLRSYPLYRDFINFVKRKGMFIRLEEKDISGLFQAEPS